MLVAGLRTLRLWAITIVFYGGSLAVAQAAQRSIVWSWPAALLLIALGPLVLAVLVGRPPLLLLTALVPIYYVGISLTASTYDTQRWSYSHLSAAVFLLAIQVIAVMPVLMSARPRSRLAP